MSRFDFVRPGAQYPAEIVPGAADWRGYDDRQSRVINGDLGGSWSPKNPVVIGGSGLTLNTSGSLFNGGVRTATGGRLVLSAAAGDFPQIVPFSRTIVIPVLNTVRVDPAVWSGQPLPILVTGPNKMGVRINGAGTGLYFDIPSRYLHGGARLATVGVTYVVTSRPAALPAFDTALSVRSSTQFLIPSPAKAVTWQPSTTYTTGFTRVIPPVHVPDGSSHYGFYYACQTASGMSGATEPAWGTTIGGTFTDGAITWKTIAALTPYTNNWVASHTFPLNTYVVGVAAGASNPFYFKATSISGTGTSAASEPAWPTTIGGTVTDNPGANQIVWTNVGHNGLWTPFGQTVDTYYANGDPQTLQVDFDGTTYDFGNNIIDTTATTYQLLLANPDPSWLITGLFAKMDSIVDLRFE